ncbi:hypothetical protein PsYK624_020120 [Phanerochaete sordida]|uniref:Uncharacterized protein n=1 Tax=Phanerochaete sordida TaxID=48140 RepID=A0A9P3L9P1_9APHY|nr:hypothetical protein PsYK624_020120 [Phanerochaete sordida]
MCLTPQRLSGQNSDNPPHLSRPLQVVVGDTTSLRWLGGAVYNAHPETIRVLEYETLSLRAYKAEGRHGSARRCRRSHRHKAQMQTQWWALGPSSFKALRQGTGDSRALWREIQSRGIPEGHPGR